MSDIAIRVEHLSKRYRLGEREPYKSLRDVIARAAAAPIHWLHRDGQKAAGNGKDYFGALDDVSFEIQQGEAVGIIGRNGAGKSTLLKILSRITKPTRGRAEIYGRVVSLLEVGTGFHPELTGRENIYLNGAILGMKRKEIERKFDEIVAFAEIEKFLDTPVKRYSSGMYVRLAFAIAAHLEPEILLVDEVLAVGDVAFQKKCLGKMGDVAKEGRTVLFVSHNMAAVEKLCSRAILLEEGHLKVDDIPQSTIFHYLHTEVGCENFSSYKVKRELLEIHKDALISITDIQLLNPSGELIRELGTGDPLVIRLFYRAQCRFVFPAFVVSIKDNHGVEITRLSTMPISGYFIKELYGEGYIDLSLAFLPLTGGQYYLDIGLARANVEFLVKFEEVVSFDVMSRDVYKSGLAIDQQRGLIVLAHKWELKQLVGVGNVDG